VVAAGAVRKNSLVKVACDASMTFKVTSPLTSSAQRAEKITAAGGSATEL